MSTHKEEYTKSKTIDGWKEGEDYDESVSLLFKDVHGKTSKEEQIAIEIYSLLLYNNIDYISKEEILEAAKCIIKIS